jgi:uncharacterized membrane-anchored protein
MVPEAHIAYRLGVMLHRHVPRLGVGFWVALCLASVFGANMGDFFAHNLGLGHAGACRTWPWRSF